MPIAAVYEDGTQRVFITMSTAFDTNTPPDGSAFTVVDEGSPILTGSVDFPDDVTVRLTLDDPMTGPTAHVTYDNAGQGWNQIDAVTPVASWNEFPVTVP